MALTTLASYKAFYGITDSANDAKIQLAIDIADAIITTFCGRSLESTAYQEYHDGNQAEILLYNTPVISITSILEDGIATTDYTIYEYEGRLVKGTDINNSYFTKNTPKFSGGLKGVKVSYTAGFTTIPADITYCANLLAKKVYSDTSRKTISAAASGSAGIKRQRLHNEEREKQPGFTSSDLIYISSQASVLPAEVIAILRQYC